MAIAVSSSQKQTTFTAEEAIIAQNKRTLSEDLIITATELRQNFLFGLDLTDDDGNQMPDKLIEFYIRSAQQWFEMEIGGLKLCEEERTEKHDYRLTDYIQYAFVKLFQYPVQEVSSVAIQFPLTENVLEFDPTWYRIESAGAQVNLFPTQGTFSSILLSQGGSFIPLLYSGIEFVPHVWHITYKSGFKKGKVPLNIVELIAKKAALGPLNLAGDLIAGAGIATKSISLDGISQAIGTTSSATNAGFGARIINYHKEIKLELESIRNYYLGLQLVVV